MLKARRQQRGCGPPERSQGQADTAGNQKDGAEGRASQKEVVSRRHPVEHHAQLIELDRGENPRDPAYRAGQERQA